MKLFSLVAPCLLLSGLSSATNHTTCSYPSKDTIKSVFSHIVSGDYPAFFTHVVDTVDWDIQGTHPLAGRYLNKTLFAVNALARLSKIQDNTAPHETTLINVVGGCDEEWSMQEMVATAVFQNGFHWTNNYAWVTRWNSASKIVQVRAYLDSALVGKAIKENEVTTNSTFSTMRDTYEPGPGGIPNMTAILGYEI
ncbi:uncharacterized protein ASPGLDRAFT_33268 [Aspergillus glaucus CBS 516.65]|uniref:SnoaL-like domain-containing protein n=1 Tax=Aspergillus glaucus CBS 516.65 TaxID=1160497 RepID=A0A1L9VR22_ASPGL|nr:hypothetical protein ASPGLDRAFT_33268 [Aspergillus glaucus CBS 516.65]OJJ86357.1 hypothetical protein ASPGLDRAFT_33268 [Aspergillus glaucus CBS 516.65]